jgi:hypothetical protein
LYPDSPVQEFDTLTIHATFNDHWLWGGAAAQMQRDQWCRDTQNAMGGYGPHGTYVHLYLNGLYWGVFNIGEKGDASYAAHYLGGDKEEYDALNSDELIDGDGNAWNTMFGIANGGITNDVAYTNLSQYLNIPNFIDYMLMNFYGANTDWPWHNWNAARRRVPGAGFHFFPTRSGRSGSARRRCDRTVAGAVRRVAYAALRMHPEFSCSLPIMHLFNNGAPRPQPRRAGCSTRERRSSTGRWSANRRVGEQATRAPPGDRRRRAIRSLTLHHSCSQLPCNAGPPPSSARRASQNGGWCRQATAWP